MYLPKTTYNNEFISNCITDLFGEIVFTHNLQPNSHFPLSLIQDMCREYKDYKIEPYTYWILHKRKELSVLPNIISSYDRLVLLNSIDNVKDISNKLGIKICTNLLV